MREKGKERRRRRHTGDLVRSMRKIYREIEKDIQIERPTETFIQ